MEQQYIADVEAILSHRYDNGEDYWTTPDHKLLKGAPFTTLESALFLLELGVPPEEAVMKQVAALILDGWKEDGRMKLSPNGGLYPPMTGQGGPALFRGL